MKSLLLMLGLMAMAAAGPVRVIKIDVPDHDAVYGLEQATGIIVADAQDRHIVAYADDAAIARVRALGYPVTVLAEDERDWPGTSFADYHSFAEVCSTLSALAATYPAITRLETLGYSAGNRPIPALLVTDNPETREGEPVVRLIGAHHGNEKISTEVTLAFLKHLCENYATSPQVRALVDEREFWVIPVMNPDGHVANSRFNANGVDLNRDYGYEWQRSAGPFSQPETRAVRSHAERHFPTLEYEYHSSASWVNYAWDNHPADPPDSAWIINLSRRYADSTYGSSLTRLSPVNGFDWYEVHGSCQDHVFGTYGGLAWTIETQQPSTRVRIDSICLANRRALLDMATIAGWGIHGRVSDSLTGAPLFARIQFTNPSRWTVFANAAAGDFHKLLEPGLYSLTVFANGYAPREFSNVLVRDTGATYLDVKLVPSPEETLDCVQRVVTVRRNDTYHDFSDWATAALGPPDSLFYTLGYTTSEIVLEPDLFRPVRNREGTDLIVYAEGSYHVYAGNDWLGPWLSLGSGAGTHGFDLAGTGLDSARYLRLVNSSSARLDAVTFNPRPGTGATEPALPCAEQPAPLPAIVCGRLILHESPAGHWERSRDITLADAAGRKVMTLAPGTNDIRHLPSGVYFVRVRQPDRLLRVQLVK
ncbi:MAG: M14 family zinc carboxypeptidase [candidate division WOR-3 bacterium]